MTRHLIAGLFAVAMLAFVAAPALAAGPVNKTLLGNAIDGYDPVAWHLLGEPVEGSKDFTHEWMGATWRFANAEHRDLFAADPERYAPAYGGYCAYGVAQGAKVGFNPDSWEIVGDRLYLNLNPGIQKKWQKDIAGFISKADRNWKRLKNR